MNKQEALKKLEEIFNPTIEKYKQKAILNQSQKTKTLKTKK